MVRILTALTTVCLVVGGCFLLPEEQQPLAPPELFQEDEVVQYDTIEVRRSDLVNEAKIHGRLTASRKADLFFRYQGGRITTIAAKANDTVSAGQVVAELNVGNLELQIEQRKLLLEKARINREMLEVTRANKYQITLAQIDVRLAELELESLERSYANLRLVVPFAGTVVWVNAEEGEYVEAFKPIIRVIDPADLVLECAADSQAAAAFVRGAAVDVSINGKDCRGTVIMTPLDAFEQTRVRDGQPGVMPAMETPASLRAAEKNYVLIRVHDLPRDAVLNDLGIATYVIARRPDAVALPKDVVNTYSGRTYVNVLREGEIEERDVEVGIQVGSEIEITKGLTGGERVVRR